MEQRILGDIAHLQARLLDAVRVCEGKPAKFLAVDHKARASDTRPIRFFLKKDDAETYSSENGHLPMFSVDKYSGTEGSAGKYFMVCSYERLWDVYERLERPPHGSPLFAPDSAWRRYGELCDAGNRTRLDKEEAEHIAYQKRICLEQALIVLPFAYEVVKAQVSCHLYLDLEGSRVTNPGADFDNLTRRLLMELRAFMCDMGLAPQALLVNPRLVVLDSSTTAKFSRHVIYKIENCLFQNNYICGALMRRFHLHLIRRFGPEETNPFYIHPFADAKSNKKVCLLDFAVYTTNRDFRMLGSCKRKGCSSEKTQLRWLWVQNHALELTKELFMDCFIQRTQTPKYLFCCVVDTINDGVPCSSSLRTPQPLGPQASSSSVGVTVTAQHTKSPNAVEPIALPRHLFARLEQLGNNVAQYLSRTPDEPFRSFFRDQKAGCKKIVLRALRDGNYAWNIETTCRYCVIRKQICGSAEHKDGGRKAKFVVWATGLTKQGTYDESKVGCIKQTCIANGCTGGVGPDRPAWSGWLGNGVSDELRKSINDVLRPHLQQLGIPMLGVPLPARSLFDYDPEYDDAAIVVAEHAETLKREREEIEIADKIEAQYVRRKQNPAE